jgi:hypothetical protein
VARPGETIGLRAWHVAERQRGQTEIAAPEVEVSLRNGAGSTLARTALRKSLVQGSEGRLAIPDGLDGVMTLVASAVVEGAEVQVERTLYVQAAIESRAPRGRAVNAFQVYELEPIRSSGPRGEDVTLDPRIEEGVCVPDLPCWLSVWTGAREGRVRVLPLAGLRPRPAVATVSHGFARFPLSVAGSEARVEIELLGADGTLVAARKARLPVVPGGIVARAAVQDGRIGVEWHQLGGPAPVLIDVFDGNRWVDALSLEPAQPVFAAPGPGVWRIQARADLFSDDTAAVAHAVVPDPAGPGPLRQAADAVLREADREGLDPLAMAILDGQVDPAAAKDALAALFAIPSFDVVSIGLGASSRVGDDGVFERAQDRRRWLAAAAILLIGLIVSSALFRLEAVARAEARGLLAALGEQVQAPARRDWAGRGLWALVLLVFVLIAVLALSKRWF